MTIRQSVPQFSSLGNRDGHNTLKDRKDEMSQCLEQCLAHSHHSKDCYYLLT